ncbi:hypothetical protein [Actinomadura welshii]|uniref:hypothetical protein n=1 Tax=Actinomadura welshii TaxID=3103817 RepID=UPI0003AD472C|nr:hypothetical protein [Actinomadura madurae]
MKRVLRAGLVAAVLAGAAAPAAAATTPPDPAPGGPQRPFEPDVAGPRNLDSLQVTATKGEGRSVTVAFDRRSRTAEGTVPAGARRFVFLFDRAISFNPQAFPTCARTVITEDGPDACPPGSQVGSGIGTSFDGTEQPVLVFNTRVGSLPGVLVVLPETNVVLEQTFERVSTPYRGTYRWTLDEILPPTSVPPQDRAGTSRFRLAFGATTHRHGRPIGFAETSARPGTPMRFGLWSEFVTGQVVLPTSTTALR